MALDSVVNSDLLFQNLIPVLKSIWPVIKIIGELGGFILVLLGISKFVSREHGDSIDKNVKAIRTFIVGIGMLNLIPVLNIAANAIFNQDSETGLSYSAPGGSDPTSLAITFSVYVVMLVGIFGVVYGIYLFNDGQREGGLSGKALTHIVGGTLAVNIVSFAKSSSSLFGPVVEGLVSKLLG